MFNKDGSPVFAKLSKDGTSAWGMVANKVWAKVSGNYLKKGMFMFMHEIIGFLTGSPYFYDYVNNSNSATIFTMLNASIRADYLF